jgi:hypothetical protein
MCSDVANYGLLTENECDVDPLLELPCSSEAPYSVHQEDLNDLW